MAPPGRRCHRAGGRADLLAACDEAAKGGLEVVHQEQGLKIHLGVKIGRAGAAPASALLLLPTPADGKAVPAGPPDRLGSGACPIPTTWNLGVGLKADRAGFIDVDVCRTGAAGFSRSVTSSAARCWPEGEEEGAMAAEIAGQKGHVNYDTIPG